MKQENYYILILFINPPSRPPKGERSNGITPSMERYDLLAFILNLYIILHIVYIIFIYKVHFTYI